MLMAHEQVEGLGRTTYKKDGDDRERHDSPALFHALLSTLKGRFRLHDGSLLLFQRQKPLELHALVSQ